MGGSEPRAAARRWRSRPVLRVVAVLALAAGAGVLTALPALAVPYVPATLPSSAPFNGVPTVGALFHGHGRGRHFCSAAVVASPGRNLVITAAHCIVGDGSGITFVPDFHLGREPYGAWSVARVYVDPQWVASRNPHHDFAFLALNPQQDANDPVQVQSVVGADQLVTNHGFRNVTELLGYPNTTNRPIWCRNRTQRLGTFLRFACRGFVGGTSGGPFLIGFNRRAQRGDVYGVIGGLHHGGCYSYISYSAYFNVFVRHLYQRAVRGGPGSVAPRPGPPGC